MHTNATSEPSGSPVPVLSPQPAHVHDEADATHQPGRAPLATDSSRPSPSSRHQNAARSAVARLLAAIRGDKYMVNAYPPAWRSAADAGALSQNHDDSLSAPVQSVVVRDSRAASGTASTASRTKER
jgi:hypothetical protein